MKPAPAKNICLSVLAGVVPWIWMGYDDVHIEKRMGGVYCGNANVSNMWLNHSIVCVSEAENTTMPK